MKLDILIGELSQFFILRMSDLGEMPEVRHICHKMLWHHCP